MQHSNFDSGVRAAGDVLSALREKTNEDLSFYTDCVRSAFDGFEPIFTKERYADFLLHCSSTIPGWIAGAVLANAQKESDGATGLIALWKLIRFVPQVEQKVLFHAYDECRHSRLFVDLVALAFPSVIAQERSIAFKQRLMKIHKSSLTKVDRVISEQELIDHLIQMNMGEIRTRIHIKLLSPILNAFSPSDTRFRVQKILMGLISDEEVHVSYTASIINAWCQNGNLARGKALFARRLRDFDLYTRTETEAAVHAYGRGNFPDLLEF